MQDKINKQITMAQIKLQIAEQELANKDHILFELYKNNPFDSEGHGAEIKLRMMYPVEYRRYIDAKINLDDLLYTRFLMMVNTEEKKVK